MAKIVRVTSVIEVDMGKVALRDGSEGITAELMLAIILKELKEGSEEEWADIADFSTFTTTGEIVDA